MREPKYKIGEEVFYPKYGDETIIYKGKIKGVRLNTFDEFLYFFDTIKPTEIYEKYLGKTEKESRVKYWEVQIKNQEEYIQGLKEELKKVKESE